MGLAWASRARVHYACIIFFVLPVLAVCMDIAIMNSRGWPIVIYFVLPDYPPLYSWVKTAGG